jgi:hypothetical protein
METFELVAMSAAMVLMFAAVGVKVAAAQLIDHMKMRIGKVALVRQEALGRLKGAQTQKLVDDQNRAALLSKKSKIVKKMNRLKSEMGQMEEEADARRQRTGMRKVE